MPEPSIRIDGLCKSYHRRGGGTAVAGYRTVREELMDLPVRLLRRLKEDKAEQFWALRDVSFEVAAGEVFGLIGNNGAGKSTLLKILSRIVRPSEGRATIVGRLGSLLEVGTGFHPELTGRENIFLSGALLGMRRHEVRRRFDEIVAFAGVEDFLDTPCKRYSSGMYVRLAFSVAAHLDVDVLLVDEVLAVGDAGFQRRCLGKMNEVARSGRTVLLVSHHLNVIRSICQSAVLMEAGRVAAQGSVNDVLAQYASRVSGSGRDSSPFPVCCDQLAIESVRILDTDHMARRMFGDDVPFAVEVEYTVREQLDDLRIVLQFVRGMGEIAFTTTDHDARNAPAVGCGRYRSCCEIPGGLLNVGQYSLVLWAGIPGRARLIEPFEAGTLQVDGGGNRGSRYADGVSWPGAVCPRLNWSISRYDHA